METVLKMQPVPMNWPIGDGDTFMGVYDRKTEDVHLFDRTAHNQTISPEYITSLDDPRIEAGLSSSQFEELHLNIGLLDELAAYDHEKFLAGEQTAVYFGSALTNFGVQLFLDDFIQMAPAPSAYPSDAGQIKPVSLDFLALCLRFRPTWTPGTETAWLFCGFAAAVSSATFK